MATLNVELSESAIRNLNVIAAEQQTSVSQVIEMLAGHAYFELSDEQMSEVDEALAAIDRGEVASEEEAKAFFSKFA
jgi:predicted transcriptional regulator